MGIGHLSDEQIQAYLEIIEQKNSEVQEHIQSCHVCQNNVQIYQKIFHGLNMAESPLLPKNFSRDVTLRLERNRERKTRFWESIILFSIFLLAIVVSFYFVNPVPTVLEIGKLLIGGLTKSIEKVIYLLNGMLSLLLMIAAIFFLLEILNKKIFIGMLNQK
jgi:hypothetical protein